MIFARSIPSRHRTGTFLGSALVLVLLATTETTELPIGLSWALSSINHCFQWYSLRRAAHVLALQLRAKFLSQRWARENQCDDQEPIF